MTDFLFPRSRRFKPVIEFNRDQLDIKKKVLAKIGEGVLLRLKFIPATNAASNGGASGPPVALPQSVAI